MILLSCYAGLLCYLLRITIVGLFGHGGSRGVDAVTLQLDHSKSVCLRSDDTHTITASFSSLYEISSKTNKNIHFSVSNRSCEATT
jgi:hypothetical protein